MARPLCLAALAALGCFDPSAAEPIRIGLNAWPGYEFLYLAQELGYYEQEGTAARVVEFSSLTDARVAYERGQLEVIATTLVDVLFIGEHVDHPPRVVAVADYSDGGDLVIGDAEVVAHGLRGARIGVELGTVGVYVLARALDQQGLSFADVTLVPTDQAGLGEGLANGTLDAGVTYAPWSATWLADGRFSAIFDTSTIPREVVDVIAVAPAVLARSPERIDALLDAYWRAVAYTTAEPTSACAIMGRREQTDGPTFCRTLSDGIRITRREDQPSLLDPNGPVATTAARSEQVLRALNLIRQPSKPVLAASVPGVD